MIFKDGEDWIGTALEFNITVAGTDPRVVEAELQDAVLGYLEAAGKIKGMRPKQVVGILNQVTDKEYESRWTTAQEAMRGSVPSPLAADMYKAGVANLALA